MIKDNIQRVKERIAAACLRAKREVSGVRLIAISKNRSIEEIKEAALGGITEFGENRVQEALSKYSELSSLKWHMVGHLQTNKVKEAIKVFDLIHSVDSLRLAQEINKEAQKLGKVQDVLLEVKTSPEEAKSGVKPDEAIGVIKEIASLENVNIKGLMTIAPIVNNPEQARPYFRRLREIRDEINSLNAIHYPCLSGRQALSVLSMGMTDDFEVAIEEGAQMVRIGRAIFEGGI